MDIMIFGDSLRIKSKKCTLAVDPKKEVQKFDADAILSTDKTSDVSRVNNYRVVIEGPGEYEVAGLKVSGIKNLSGIIYSLFSENMKVVITKASYLKDFPSDKMGDYQIAIINMDTDIDESKITSMEPRTVVLYGQKSAEGAKILGRDNITSSSKISISEEKLPEEMNVMLLA